MPVFRDVQTSRNDGWVAQLVEQRIENPRVGGSIPPPATTNNKKNQPLTQQAEWFFYAHFNHTPITHFLTNFFVSHMLVP